MWLGYIVCLLVLVVMPESSFERRERRSRSRKSENEPDRYGISDEDDYKKYSNYNG